MKIHPRSCQTTRRSLYNTQSRGRTILGLSYNRLMGGIPESFGRLTQLESLKLTANHNMGSTLPQLTQLRQLDLSYMHPRQPRI